jgi:hypothetical protein
MYVGQSSGYCSDQYGTEMKDVNFYPYKLIRPEPKDIWIILKTFKIFDS